VLVVAAFAVLACGEATVVTEEPPPDKAAAKAKAAPEPKVEAEAEEEEEGVAIAADRKLPKTPATFDEAVAAAKEIHDDHRKDFFCGCTYGSTGKVLKPSCGYRTRADDSLAKRIAWDRVVPVFAFGAHRACWKSPMCKDESGTAFSGVQCCREKDPVFRAMEADLHNIVPMISELNADRSNFTYADVPKEERLYGACDVEVDRAKKLIEPPESVRGDIARIHFYMRDVYGDELPLTPAELAMFEQWNTADPPDAWEVDRNRRVATIQGRANDHLPIRLPAGGEPEPAEPDKPEAAPAVPAEGAVHGSP
jgi:deoxyribonuclease-1